MGGKHVFCSSLWCGKTMVKLPQLGCCTELGAPSVESLTLNKPLHIHRIRDKQPVRAG